MPVSLTFAEGMGRTAAHHEEHEAHEERATMPQLSVPILVTPPHGRRASFVVASEELIGTFP